MSNHPYNVELYNSMLESTVNAFSIMAVVLAILFIIAIAYSITQMKEEKKKIVSYILIFLLIAASIFVLNGFVSQILSYRKDLAEERYVQYEGPANVSIQSTHIPRDPPDYIISFEQNGEHIELCVKKDPGVEGDIEKIYVAYSKSGFVFELEIIE